MTVNVITKYKTGLRLKRTILIKFLDLRGLFMLAALTILIIIHKNRYQEKIENMQKIIIKI